MNYKSKTRKRGKVGKLVKSRKYSKLRKYSKKRRSTYKYRNKTQNFYKKRTTLERRRSRRKMYGGVGECNNAVQSAIAAIGIFPRGFKTFFDILEKCPDVIQFVKYEYKKKIELKDNEGKSTGYIGLLGLQLINYLNARITKLRIQRDKLIETGTQDNDKLLKDIIEKIETLKTAISLMDQVAAAPGVGEEQMSNIKERVDKKYYECYVKLYNELATQFNLKKRSSPLSTSLCYFSDTCDSDKEVCDTCCIPDNLDFTTPTDDEESDDEESDDEESDDEEYDVQEPPTKKNKK